MFEQAFRNIDDVLWKEAGCTTCVFASKSEPKTAYICIPNCPGYGGQVA
jgi:hypothetical protein